MKETGSLRDEIRQEQLKGLEGKSTLYKIRYYVYYYKWYAIVILAVVIIAGIVIRDIRANKDSVLGVAVINSLYGADYEEIKLGFEEELELDDKHEVDIDTQYTISADEQNGFDMQSQEKLFVRMAAGQLDIIIAPESVFKKLADVGYMRDLNMVLTKEEYEKYGAVFMASIADDSVEAVDNENAPRHDVPTGISIGDYKKIKEYAWYYNCTEPVYLGFADGGSNTDNAIRFLEYLRQ